MTSFSMYTEVSVEVYLPQPKGTDPKDVGDTYSGQEIPPFLGKGIYFNENGAPDNWTLADGGWSADAISVPATYSTGGEEQFFTGHEIRVSNRIGDALADPCLQNAPVVTETLPNFFQGFPDVSPINFSVLNPYYKRFFSNEFITTQSLVQIYRVIGGTKTRVWRGNVTGIEFNGEVETRILARTDLKKLDEFATFGFDADLPRWESRDYRIPIICARLIPYDIEVQRLGTQLVKTYANWYRDLALYGSLYDNLLSGGGYSRPSGPRPTTIDASEIQEQRTYLSNLINLNQQPQYVGFGVSELVPSLAYPITGYRPTTVKKETISVRSTRLGLLASGIDNAFNIWNDGVHVYVGNKSGMFGFQRSPFFRDVDADVSFDGNSSLTISTQGYGAACYRNESLFILVNNTSTPGTNTFKRPHLAEISMYGAFKGTRLGYLRNYIECSEILFEETTSLLKYTGVDTDGRYYYLLNDTDNKIECWDHYGTRFPENDMTLSSGSWVGIAYCEGFVITIDNTANKLYFLRASFGLSGQRLSGYGTVDTTKTFNLSSSYTYRDITYFGQVIYVLGEVPNVGTDILRYWVNRIISSAPSPTTSFTTRFNTEVGLWINLERGIFILPHEDESVDPDQLDLSSDNFRDSVLPEGIKDVVILDHLHDTLPPLYQLNVNESFVTWVMLNYGLLSNKPDRLFLDSKGNQRVPHPLDGYFKYADSSVYNDFLLFFIHSRSENPEIIRVNQIQPTKFYEGYWSHVVRSITPDNAIHVDGRTNVNKFFDYRYEKNLYNSPRRTHLLRCKDLYTTGSSFNEFESVARITDRSLNLFHTKDFISELSLGGAYEPSADSGSADAIVKCLPAFHLRDPSDNPWMRSPDLTYRRSSRGGGAYYMSARYPVGYQIDGVSKFSASYQDIGRVVTKPNSIIERNLSEDFPIENVVATGMVRSTARYYIAVNGETTLEAYKFSGERVAGDDIDLGVIPHCIDLVGSSLFVVFQPPSTDQFPRYKKINVYSISTGNRVTSHALDDTRILYHVGGFAHELTSSLDSLVHYSERFTYSDWLDSVRFTGISVDEVHDKVYLTYDRWTISSLVSGSRSKWDMYVNGLYIFPSFSVNSDDPFHYQHRAFSAITSTGANEALSRDIPRLKDCQIVTQGTKRSGYTQHRHLYLLMDSTPARPGRLLVFDVGQGLGGFRDNRIIYQPDKTLTLERDPSLESFNGWDDTSGEATDYSNRVDVGNYVAVYRRASGNLYTLANVGGNLEARKNSNSYRSFEWAHTIISSSSTQTVMEGQISGIGDFINWNPDTSTGNHQRRINFFNNVLNFYYHHDMMDADDSQFMPTNFIYAVLKNARLNPGFKLDGSDVEGPINDHKMQLIESTDRTYRELVKRVLPALGYMLRYDPVEDHYQLIDFVTKKNPTYQFGDNMIDIVSIRYNAREQYTSFIFENDDMIRGKNTLEEWLELRDSDDAVHGRYVIFNNNPFTIARHVTIKTGTWTAEYDKFATFMSLRADRYTFRVSNFHFITDDGEIKAPLLGDRVRIKSVKVPHSSGEEDILITGRKMSELDIEFQGLALR